MKIGGQKRREEVITENGQQGVQGVEEEGGINVEERELVIREADFQFQWKVFKSNSNLLGQELQKAAGNYSGNLVFNHDELCNSKWYNGFLEGQVISVRRYFGVLYTEYVINEFCLVAQMSAQKSVLKLLGCCLGTEIPILVYEFSANRNLVDHLRRRQGVQSFIIMEE